MKNKSILAMAGIWGGLTSLCFDENNDLEGIDIDKEYHLIQKKQSKLPARLRRVVEHRYKLGHQP